MNGTTKMADEVLTGVSEKIGVPTPISPDGCDRCPAAVMVRVELGSLDLAFCSHHYSKGEPKLAALGARVVYDDRASLTTKPGASAAA